MRDYLALGPCPSEEDAVQVDSANYRANAYRQGHSYIQAIQNLVGIEPEGAELAIKSFEHDFGTYFEVVCYFDPDNRVAVEYAYRCEAESPTTFAQTGVNPPKLLPLSQHGKP